jgi:hypothetical protein
MSALVFKEFVRCKGRHLTGERCSEKVKYGWYCDKHCQDFIHCDFCESEKNLKIFRLCEKCQEKIIEKKEKNQGPIKIDPVNICNVMSNMASNIFATLGVESKPGDIDEAVNVSASLMSDIFNPGNIGLHRPRQQAPIIEEVEDEGKSGDID